MNLNSPVIICASGNSVSEGIELGLFDVLKNHITIGLNYWYKFAFEPTFTTFVDWQFYRDNLEELSKLGLIIAKHDPQLNRCRLTRGTAPIDIQQSNTILLPKHGTYFGKESFNIKYRKCLQVKCNHIYERDWKVNRPEACPRCGSKGVIKYGVYTGHLSGLFALTLAIALGFKNIYLLGYDCCEVNGKTHFYQDQIDLTQRNADNDLQFRGIGVVNHKNGSREYKTSAYNNKKNLNNQWFNPYLQELPNINIVNVSPESQITVFQKMKYPEFLKLIGEGNIDQTKIREEIKNYINEKIK